MSRPNPKTSTSTGLETAVVLTLGALCIVGIGALRAPLTARFQSAVQKSDDYLLPPVAQTVVASLGYRSALADLIYAHVLVSYGIHFQEKHNFEFVGSYLDTVNALDPKFRDPYRFADTLLTIQPEPVSESAYHKAREILERGLKELPYDTELWSSAGQFLAYIAAPRLSSEAEAAAWRLDGARKLARACELMGDNENVPYHCINAATLLNEAGEHAAMNEFLRKFLLVNDDPEVRSLAMAALQRSSSDINQALDERLARFNQAWRLDLPFVTRSALLVIGPRNDTARCAGLAAPHSTECASSWRDWFEQRDEATNAEP
jgi:tetratricopeptide (TPR) repeat protein